jgi:hypothetical protein
MPEWYGGSALSSDHSLAPARQWLPQWERVGRWHQRAIRLRDKSARFALDAYDQDELLAFFQDCFHLRDWLLESRPDRRSPVESLFASNPEMGLCRDIANGFKHKRLKHPSHDADFNVVREFDHFLAEANPTASPIRYWIAADIGGKLVKFDIFDLIERCYQHWCALIGFIDEPNR